MALGKNCTSCLVYKPAYQAGIFHIRKAGILFDKYNFVCLTRHPLHPKQINSAAEFQLQIQ